MQEWPEMDAGKEIDLYNVNVPLDLRDTSFAANRGVSVMTTVDHTSQYSSLYGAHDASPSQCSTTRKAFHAFKPSNQR